MLPHASDLLAKGHEILAQEHGISIAKVIADDIAWHSVAATQAMAHLASADKRFREALADNGHEPDRFAALLRSGTTAPRPLKSAVGQLAEIYA